MDNFQNNKFVFKYFEQKELLEPIGDKNLKLRAYNPSFTWHNGKLLMAYRISNYTLCKEEDIEYFGEYRVNFYNETLPPIISEVVLATLDPESLKIVEFHNLELSPPKECDWCHGYEDPRIISFRNKLYILVAYRDKKTIFNLTLIELSNDLDLINIIKIEPEFDNNHHQKNWNPFIYNNDLYFVYTVLPHKIVQVDLKSGRASIVYETTSNIFDDMLDDYVIRGGSSYIIYKNNFIGVSRGMKIKYVYDPEYVSIIYGFEAKPPFKPIKRSNPFLFTENSIKDLRHPVEMATGLIRNNDKIVIGMGINDCDLGIAEISLDNFINNLSF